MHIANAEPAASGMTARVVLVVEDEWIIRMHVVDVLRERGWRVVEAVDGDEAVEFLQSGAAVDLIFTDVRMPGAIDGLALLDFARRTRPHVPVIVSSGHLASHTAIDAGAAAFLIKPYLLDVVANVVADVMPEAE